MSIVVHNDLASCFGPPRDQGARPTCLAFATSDCHAAVRGSQDPLSCEWLYHRAQARCGRSHAEGATLPGILAALRLDGQPVEAGWPYLSVVGERWEPPAGSPQLFKREGAPAGADVGTVRRSLDRGRPIMMLMALSRSFFTPGSDGAVRPTPEEVPDPSIRHAVVASGHGLVDGRPAIRVRNSWGAGWGLDGSAWLTDDFIAPRLFATAELLGEIDVSSD
jgi:hypothetical protein